MFFFFFFQAEDGIRDIGVTGVQTCALPICAARRDVAVEEEHAAVVGGERRERLAVLRRVAVARLAVGQVQHRRREDRKSVVEGKSVDLGGRRIIKKKKTIILNSVVATKVLI